MTMCIMHHIQQGALQTVPCILGKMHFKHVWKNINTSNEVCGRIELILLLFDVFAFAFDYLIKSDFTSKLWFC